MSAALRKVLRWNMDYTQARSGGLEGHRVRAERVAAKVKAWAAQDPKTRKKLCTARAPWQNLSTRFSEYKERSECVYVGDLSNVVEMDEEAGTVTVEPMVQVGQVTRYLLPRGRML